MTTPILPLTPMRRAGSDYVSGGGLDLVIDKIRQFCMTDPGELPWRPAFGAGLGAMVHMSNDDVTAALAKARISDGLRLWLGAGAKVQSVTPVRGSGLTSLTLNITFTIDQQQANTLIEMPRQDGIG